MGWYLLAVDLPAQPGEMEMIWADFLKVPTEVWGVIFSFGGAVFYVSERAGWPNQKKAFAALFGTMIGWTIGYAFQMGLSFAGLNFLVYASGGVFGFNFAGGIDTLGGNFKKKPLQTVNDVADTYQKVKKAIKNENEKPDDPGSTERIHGDSEPDGKP